jgi:hypothetical protein
MEGNWTTGVQSLRDRFLMMPEDAFGDSVGLNGHPERRPLNTLNVSFVGRVGAKILAAMPAGRGLDLVSPPTGKSNSRPC